MKLPIKYLNYWYFHLQSQWNFLNLFDLHTILFWYYWVTFSKDMNKCLFIPDKAPKTNQKKKKKKIPSKSNLVNQLVYLGYLQKYELEYLEEPEWLKDRHLHHWKAYLICVTTHQGYVPCTTCSHIRGPGSSPRQLSHT